MYDCKSKIATEFIDDQEIMDTLTYAAKNKSNRALINEILERAKDCKGLSHREAAVLLECDLEDENQRMTLLAQEIKQNFYKDIAVFAYQANFSGDTWKNGLKPMKYEALNYTLTSEYWITLVHTV